MLEFCACTATRDRAGTAAAPAASCRKCLRRIFMAFPPRNAVRAMLWYTLTGPCVAVRKLLELDVGNHLAPLHGLFGDEFAELGRRTCQHRSTWIGEPHYEFGVRNADVDLLVQSFNDFIGRVFWSADTE